MLKRSSPVSQLLSHFLTLVCMEQEWLEPGTESAPGTKTGEPGSRNPSPYLAKQFSSAAHLRLYMDIFCTYVDAWM